MFNPNLNARATSIASKACYIANKINTTIKLNHELNLSNTSLNQDKRPSKRVPRSKRK